MAKYPGELDSIPVQLLMDRQAQAKKKLPWWRKLFYPYLTQAERREIFNEAYFEHHGIDFSIVDARRKMNLQNELAEIERELRDENQM